MVLVVLAVSVHADRPAPPEWARAQLKQQVQPQVLVRVVLEQLLLQLQQPVVDLRYWSMDQVAIASRWDSSDGSPGSGTMPWMSISSAGSSGLAGDCSAIHVQP